MKRLSVLLFSLLVPLLVGGAARAQSKAASSAQGGELYSIEKRDLMGRHELTASLGVLPMDAFARGMTLHGSYTYHFSHLIAWEIVGGMWSFNFGTGLDQELKDNFLVQATDVPELRWVINSNFVLKPLYGKFALTNDKLFSAEMFFVLGYAMGGYTASYPSGLDIGAGLRMFLGRYFSLRLDIRDYMFFPGFNSMSNNLYVALGLSITFGFSDEKEKED
jgi:outer membrane beta-barrel protein